jgi:cellulose synthase (UDP-forming)
MLASVSFPIYISALLNAISGKEQKWHVTGSKTKAQSPFNFMIPQVLTFVFLLLTSVVAIWRDVDNSLFTLATAWNLINTFILGAFMVVGFRESWRIKHPQPTPADSEVADRPAHLTTVIVPRELEQSLGVPAEDIVPDGAVRRVETYAPTRAAVNGNHPELAVNGDHPDFATINGAAPKRAEKEVLPS